GSLFEVEAKVSPAQILEGLVLSMLRGLDLDAAKCAGSLDLSAEVGLGPFAVCCRCSQVVAGWP
ncbi:MAG: hypothetical protein ABR558_11720, partial [Thioalkalivibrio sp.]